MMHTLIGVAIGQKRDPSAICVAEQRIRWTRDVAEQESRKEAERKTEAHFLIRHLERLPIGTSYPEVARRVGEVVESVQSRETRLARIYVDVTGLGKPVLDLISEEVSAPSPLARPAAVYFTHGDRRNEERDFGRITVTLGKAFLVSRLQVLLQSRQLHLPQTPEAEALAQDLRDYEIKVDENANDRYGAFSVGPRDDLITALGLAVQERYRPPCFSMGFGTPGDRCVIHIGEKPIEPE